MAPLAVSFGLTLVSAALLGPELRGVLTFLMTGALLAGALAYGSLHVPVVEALRNQDRSGLRHGLRLMWVLAGTLSVVGLALVVVGGPGRAEVPSTVATLGWSLIGGGIVVVQLFTGRVLQGLARTGPTRSRSSCRACCTSWGRDRCCSSPARRSRCSRPGTSRSS